MLRRLKPDYFFSHYTQIDTVWMNKHGFRTILSDLDETLVAHNAPYDDTFSSWYRKLEDDGFALIIASNNVEERVHSFTRPFSIVGYGKCQKPSTKVLEEELFHKGLDPQTTLFLGDQIFTDMWCASNLGVQKALVKPISNGDKTWLMKIKRIGERVLLSHWKSSFN